jgi:hypothetical protein
MNFNDFETKYNIDFSNADMMVCATFEYPDFANQFVQYMKNTYGTDEPSFPVIGYGPELQMSFSNTSQISIRSSNPELRINVLLDYIDIMCGKTPKGRNKDDGIPVITW